MNAPTVRPATPQVQFRPQTPAPVVTNKTNHLAVATTRPAPQVKPAVTQQAQPAGTSFDWGGAAQRLSTDFLNSYLSRQSSNSGTTINGIGGPISVGAPAPNQMQAGPGAAGGDYMMALQSGSALLQNLFDNKKDPVGGMVNGAAFGMSVGGPWGALIGGVAGGVIGLFGGHDHPDTIMRNQVRDGLRQIMGDGLEIIASDGSLRDLDKVSYQVDFTKPGMDQAVGLVSGLGRIIGAGSPKIANDFTGIFANAVYDPDPAKLLANATQLMRAIGIPPQTGQAALTQMYMQGQLFDDDYVVGMQSFQRIADGLPDVDMPRIEALGEGIQFPSQATELQESR